MKILSLLYIAVVIALVWIASSRAIDFPDHEIDVNYADAIDKAKANDELGRINRPYTEKAAH